MRSDRSLMLGYISDTSLAFLDVNVSVEGNGLCTSVHYKPTDSHSYLLYSSSHPSHVKNSIPYSQFLRLRRLCSEDSDFSLKSAEMCEFFGKRGYPAPVVEAGHHRAQQIDRQSALQTSQKENNNRIPFTLTFHPHNHAVKSIILKNFKLLQNDPDTGRIFSQPPLISFKRDKNIANFLVRSAFQTSEQHFHLPNHSKQHMTVCGLSLHQGNTESRKTLEQKFIFKIGTLNPHGINERFSFN